MKFLLAIVLMSNFSIAMQYDHNKPFTEQVLKLYNFPESLREAAKNKENKSQLRVLCLMVSQWHAKWLDSSIIQKIEKFNKPNVCVAKEDLKEYAYYFGSYNNHSTVGRPTLKDSAEIIHTIANNEDWTPEKTGETILNYWQLMSQIQEQCLNSNKPLLVKSNISSN